MEKDVIHTVTDAVAPQAVPCHGKVSDHCARVDLRVYITTYSASSQVYMAVCMVLLSTSSTARV